ncbi:cupin domain-containing protein [Nubsella zeaxanthinifaciens]|uniref:cupin domain-containing protein n=1 Tax=Nubsella zeaxanthinifaciens TaxID=392412 RepID=UPI003CFCB55F
MHSPRRFDLEEILFPLNLNDFFENYYLKKSVLVKSTDQMKFVELFSFKELNQVLNNNIDNFPTLKLVKEAKPLFFDSPDSVIEHVKNGASLIIDQLQEYSETVRELCSSVSKRLSEPTQVNLYLSQPDIKAFDLHYDTHDVLILQIAGKKHWRVYDATIDNPVFFMKEHGIFPDGGQAYIDMDIEAGDVLYIPRGHWHEALATDGLSVHLTLGILSRTGIDFLDFLKEELISDSKWRENFLQIEKHDNTHKTHLEKLKKSLIEFINKDDILEKYIIKSTVLGKRANPYNFPFQIIDNNQIEYNSLRYSVYDGLNFFMKEVDGALLLYASKKVIKLSVNAKKIIEVIFQLQDFALADLEEAIKKYQTNINRRNLELLIMTLMKNNILYIK